METISSKDEARKADYIVFLDLDRTITGSISGRALAKAAFRKGMMTCRDLINAIYISLLYRLKLTDPDKLINRMVGWSNGIEEKAMNDLCSEVCLNILIPSVYREAIDEIKSHKSKNARVVILSSALTCICRRMSAWLKTDDIICSELEVLNGHLTGRPVGRLCFGEEKAVRLAAYCEKYKYPASSVWYYGDSISDLPALEAAGHPVCINPDRALRKIAAAREWEIFRWKG